MKFDIRANRQTLAHAVLPVAVADTPCDTGLRNVRRRLIRYTVIRLNVHGDHLKNASLISDVWKFPHAYHYSERRDRVSPLIVRSFTPPAQTDRCIFARLSKSTLRFILITHYSDISTHGQLHQKHHIPPLRLTLGLSVSLLVEFYPLSSDTNLGVPSFNIKFWLRDCSPIFTVANTASKYQPTLSIS